MTGAKAEMRRYAELAADLLAIPITTKQRELFITQFIPMPPPAAMNADATSASRWPPDP